jgi:hypothetical protein
VGRRWQKVAIRNERSFCNLTVRGDLLAERSSSTLVGMAAATVKEYLANLPADRREALEAVRKVILANLDEDFEEGIQYGMIGYYVPHRVFPAGYHCDPKQPLPFAGLGRRKTTCPCT